MVGDFLDRADPSPEPVVEHSPEGWILLPVTDEIIREARAIRARRDRLYPNIYEEEETDLRWVGEVGEICLFHWLRARAPGAGTWLRRRAAGKPDFLIRNHGVGLKTVKRQVPFRASYTAQITARHAAEPVDHFFFASYEVPRQRLWFLGGTTRADFLENARYHGPRQQVHSHYVVREGHEIYNIEARYLTPPETWLSQLLGDSCETVDEDPASRGGP